jgi:hypothetical protein
MNISAEIQKHCAANGISIIRLSTGVVRFLGAGIDITLAEGSTPKLENLQPYAARKGRNLKNV